MAVRDQLITDKFAIYNGDCVEVMKGLPSGSVHLSIYSPPFGGLYHYSSDDRDLSNCPDYDKFFDHYAYVVRELARVTMPGRVTCVHAMDVPRSNSGTDSYIDFPGDIIRLHEREGWKFTGRRMIWKEPLAVRLRTMAITCIAGLAGLPQVSLPLTLPDGTVLGVSLLGPAGSDLALIRLAVQLQGTLNGQNR